MALPACETGEASHDTARRYRRRRPEETPLYRVLLVHLETFLERAATDPSRPGLPAFVERELRRFLECGVLAHGFVRVYCPGCRRDALVAFSCKGRGFCPSCGGRRMSESAAHLVDRVLPDVPVRQWVLTLPHPLRFPDEDVANLLAHLLAHLLATLRRRILRLLEKRGKLDETGLSRTELEERHPLLAHIAAASIRGRIALGSRPGSTVERLGTPTSGGRPAPPPRELCAHHEGFSLHASVLIPAGKRDALEHLCRYVARSPIANERLSLDERGRVLLQLAHPWSDGTTHIAFEPLVFLERLAALVPRPRTHLLTYHGVLAPAASWRDEIIPPPIRLSRAASAFPMPPDGLLTTFFEPDRARPSPAPSPPPLRSALDAPRAHPPTALWTS